MVIERLNHTCQLAHRAGWMHARSLEYAGWLREQIFLAWQHGIFVHMQDKLPTIVSCANPACHVCNVCVSLAPINPFPGALLQTRVKEQRRKAFDEAQRKALADASAALQAAGNGKPPTTPASGTAAAAAAGEVLTAQDVAGAVAGSSSPAKPGVDAAGGKAAGPGKAELEARVAYLQEAAKNYDDPGASSTVSSIVSVNVHVSSG
jgi:hypothetical protein